MSQACNSSLIFYPQGSVQSTSVDYLLVVTIILALFIIFSGFIVFRMKKPYYDRLKVRHTLLVALTMFGVLSQIAAGPVASLTDTVFQSYPCWLRLFFMVMVPTGIGSSVLIKLMLFHFMSSLSRIAVKRHREMAESFDSESTQDKIRHTFVALKVGFRSLFRPLDEGSSETMLALKFLVSLSGQLTIASIVAIPYLLLVLVISLVIPEYKAGCSGCRTYPVVFIAFAIAALSLFLFCVLLFLRIRNMPDFWGFGREILYVVIAVIIAVISFFLAFMVRDEFQLPQTIGLSLTVAAQTLYPVYIATKTEGKRKIRPQKSNKKKKVQDKHQQLAASPGSSHVHHSSVISSINMDLKLVMQYPELMKGFEEHLIKELATESLLFYKDASEWKSKYDGNTPAQNLGKARSLYKEYVQAGSVLEINISSDMRSDLEVRIMTKDNVERTVFDAALKEMAFMLQTGPLNRFTSTAEYASIVEKLGLTATTTAEEA